MHTPMDMLTQGVYLIGSSSGGIKNLMTAAWVTQISAKALMVAVGETHFTADLIRQSGHFSVSVLSAGQKDIALQCGTRSGRRADKLAGLQLEMTPQGDPLLSDAAAHFSCRVIHSVKVLDHVLFCAEIEDARLLSGEPLRYREEEYFKK